MLLPFGPYPSGPILRAPSRAAAERKQCAYRPPARTVDFALKVIPINKSEIVRLQVRALLSNELTALRTRRSDPLSPPCTFTYAAVGRCWYAGCGWVLAGCCCWRGHRTRSQMDSHVFPTPTPTPTPLPAGYAGWTMARSAGQERFGSLTRVYYQGASACVIVFDITQRRTFAAVSKWKVDLDSKVTLSNGQPVPCLLLANKCDLKIRAVSNEEIDRLAKDLGFIAWSVDAARLGRTRRENGVRDARTREHARE